MVKYSTHDKPFFPDSLEEKFALISELGFNSYEIDGKVLLENYKEAEKAAKQNNLSFTAACNGTRGWIGDFDEEKRKMAIQDITKMLQIGSEIGVPGFVAPAAFGMFSLFLPPFISPRSAEKDREILLDSLFKLDKICQETGTKIFFEPLLRYQDHMMNNLETGANIIDAGGFKNVKLCADFFHMNMEEADINKSLEKYIDYIGHIHLSDSNRLHPGGGHIDFLSGLKILKNTGYKGGFAVECVPAKENPLNEYRKSVDLTKKYFEIAGFEI